MIARTFATLEMKCDDIIAPRAHIVFWCGWCEKQNGCSCAEPISSFRCGVASKIFEIQKNSPVFCCATNDGKHGVLFAVPEKK